MNTLCARLSCSFKGEIHDLHTVIDLDSLPLDAEEPPDFHRLLAQAAAIDPYSYLYEVVESHDIEFSAATGVAAQCCELGQFDWRRYVRLQREEGELVALRAIAARTLGVSDLDQHPDLKAAMLAAYRAGKGEQTDG
ncbi:MAG: hypothetical protein HZB71_03160 [Betaproteobacteria bacterium]|nr:hypothetical protein [Betaproteobacteria bacterium]